MKKPTKTAVITGAASGIGKATALLFAKKNIRIIIADIDEKGANEAVLQIKYKGGEAHFHPCNVSDPKAVADLFQWTIDQFGTIDYAINNAGVGGVYQPAHLYRHTDYDEVIAVNQTGVFYCLQKEMEIMLRQNFGAIVNVASLAGLKGLPNAIAYTASKHAVLGMTKTAALEAAKSNIRINAVCPVFTHSTMFDQLLSIDPSMADKLKKSIPMRRFGKPEDIAQAIYWLCDDQNTFVTGLCLPIDGGTSA